MNKITSITIVAVILILIVGYIALKPKPVKGPVVTAPTETQENPETKETMNIKLYFHNTITDPTFKDCNVVVPVMRTIPYTTGTARAALTELIKGPTAEEKSQGYRSGIDPNTKINSITITEGVAKVDFSKELQKGNVGLCARLFIVAQIRETLLQFPTVEKVTFTVEGVGEKEGEEFVQP